MKFQDRIKELRRVPVKDLVPNPKNYRTHGKAQKHALTGLLESVGFAGAVLARELADGKLMLIDGHLRTEVVGKGGKIPVLVLDVTEAEADTILATYDPIAAMAGTDAAALESLLQGIQVSHDGVAKMLADLSYEAQRATAPVFTPELTPESGARPVTPEQVEAQAGKLEGRFVDGGNQQLEEVVCPHCGGEFALDLSKA
jgi:hypothetical protein